jgi:hypothetical protein
MARTFASRNESCRALCGAAAHSQRLTCVAVLDDESVLVREPLVVTEADCEPRAGSMRA